VTHKTSQLAVS